MILKVFRAQESKVRPFMAGLGLSAGQPKVLRFLAGRQKCLQKDIAMGCNIEPATASRILNLMEDGGLIVRSSDAGDKRAVLVDVTEKGLRLHEAFDADVAVMEEAGMKGFSDAEQALFASFLQRFYKNLTGTEISD